MKSGLATRRLKYAVGGCFNGVWGDEPNGIDDLAVIRVADFDREKARVVFKTEPTIRAIPTSARNRRMLSSGDLLIEKSGGGEQQPVGNVVLFEGATPCVCSNFVARMPVAADCAPRFVSYVFQALYLDGRNIPHVKQTSGIQNLDSDSYLNEVAWLPPRAEQQRIAKFLDDKTARIDALIAEKGRLMESAKNLFEAKLGTAVVQGAAPGNRMIEAAEKGYAAVRSDWDLTPLKHLATWSGGMTPSKDRPDFWVGEIPWISPKDMKIFYIGNGVDHISDQALSETSLRLLPAGSVLVVVRGMILAHTFPVAVTTAPLTINQDMKAMRPNESKMSTLYLAWMLRGLQPLMLSLTEESAHGTKVLRTDQWANQCVPVPTLAEQHNLVHSFQEWEAQTSSLVSDTTKAIGLLREYRSSIISAAVCGQMTVS